MDDVMRDEYDFSNGRKNPYVSAGQKRQITIRIDNDTISYFKNLANKTAIPYQTLMNMYLADCAANQRELQMAWTP